VRDWRGHQTGVAVKAEVKWADKACARALAVAIMATALLSGCAVALLGGAARSGGDSAPARAASGTASSAGNSQAASDGSISAAVRSRFSANASLKTLKTVVDTHDGIVTLRGQVTKVEVRTAAEAQARSVTGVKGVQNLITVR
jgi:osmotically-inducible protein OsmY